jgi:hypothetical protein
MPYSAVKATIAHIQNLLVLIDTEEQLRAMQERGGDQRIFCGMACKK